MAEKTINIDELTENAQEQLEQAGAYLGKQANELRKTMAGQLREAKKNIRSQVKSSELDKDQKAQVNNVLNRLDTMADFLEGNSVEEMEKQATRAVQENVWRNLIIAFVIGLVVGILFTRD